MSDEIKQLFSDIHERYDLMNHVLSLGVDKKWREQIAKEALLPKDSYRLLDIATGTGDLAIAIKKMAESKAKVVDLTGVDFNGDMLGLAKKKAEQIGCDVNFMVGDALKLKFPDNSFDIITNSFAMRDFDSLEGFIEECRRVLKKGGKVVLADMSAPDRGFMKYFFKFYSRIMVLEGSLIDRNAYSFLVSSIKKFDKKRLETLMKEKGFAEVEVKDLQSGIAFVATGYKK